jgi:acyl-coenzyme A synthetase/AMP-(fatty) acid ligase
VEISVVAGRKSPITGAIVVADVVLRQAVSGDTRDIRVLQREIIESCQAVLAPYKVPTTVRFVPSLAVTGSGKLARGAG